MIDACFECGVKKLIFAASCDAANDINCRTITESSPIAKNPGSYYGYSKGLAEEIVLAANGMHGLCTCALASMLIWGPGDTQFYEIISKTRHMVHIGKGDNLWEPIFVKNSAHAMWLASKKLHPNSSIAGRKLFISDDAPISTHEFMKEFMENVHGEGSTVSSIPYWIALIAAYVIEWICWLIEPIYKVKPILSPMMVYNSMIEYKFDISDAKKELGYSPIVSRKDGMIACKTYFKEGKCYL